MAEGRIGLRGRIKVGLRLIAVMALALPLMPVQAFARRQNLALAASLPCWFHKKILRIIGVRVEVVGGMEAQRPLLILANHVSWLDILVLGSVAPLCFIAKREVSGWPVVGLLARLQRSVFVDREARARTGEATRSIGQRLRQGDAMVLFAEGTTGDGLHVLPFRSALMGAAHNALDDAAATALVQPLAIRYMARGGLPVVRSGLPHLAWTGDTDLAPHLAGVLAGGPVDVRVSWGEAMAFTPQTDRKALTRSAEDAVRTLMAR